MALAAFGATVKQQIDPNGLYAIEPAAQNPVVASATIVADMAAVVADAVTVAANVATLVADGASPTQAHVTTLNTHWGTLNTAIGTQNTDQTAFLAGFSGLTGNVSLVFDTAVVTNTNQLKAALRAILTTIAGSGLLTP